VKTQLSADVVRNPDQLCTAEHSPQALLPKVPPGLNPKAEPAFQKLCEALSMAEGTSEATGGCRAHRDPDRLHWRSINIRQASEKLWAAA
jgi:hypothetical protein